MPHDALCRRQRAPNIPSTVSKPVARRGAPVRLPGARLAVRNERAVEAFEARVGELPVRRSFRCDNLI